MDLMLQRDLENSRGISKIPERHAHPAPTFRPYDCYHNYYHLSVHFLKAIRFRYRLQYL